MWASDERERENIYVKLNCQIRICTTPHKSRLNTWYVWLEWFVWWPFVVVTLFRRVFFSLFSRPLVNSLSCYCFSALCFSFGRYSAHFNFVTGIGSCVHLHSCVCVYCCWWRWWQSWWQFDSKLDRCNVMHFNNVLQLFSCSTPPSITTAALMRTLFVSVFHIESQESQC